MAWTSDRPRRKCSQKTPSGVHYLGYVEENETPEMIMKKFETMDRFILETAGQNNNVTADSSDEVKSEKNQQANLTEDQMAELFQKTSVFAPHQLTQQEQFSIPVEQLYFQEDDEDSFHDGDNDEEFWEDGNFEEEEKSKKSKSRLPGGSSGSKRPRETPTVTDEQGYVYTLKKRAKEKGEVEYCRIPTEPLPRSWAVRISPEDPEDFNDDSLMPYKYIESDNIIGEDLSKYGKFQAILMDPPWQLPHLPPSPLLIHPRQLAKLKITSQLIPNGLVFIWTEKEFIPQAVGLLKKWGFIYVENLVWVKKSVDNKMLAQPYRYFNRSKNSLMIFRKEAEGSLELRHQRNVDVCFDFVQSTDGIREDKPDYVYHMIETLLPQASDYSTGIKLLELWGRPGHKRQGWVTLIQKGLMHPSLMQQSDEPSSS